MAGIVIARGRRLDVVTATGWISGCGAPVSGNALPLLLHHDVQPHCRLGILNLGDKEHHCGWPSGGRSMATCQAIPQLPSLAPDTEEPRKAAAQ